MSTTPQTADRSPSRPGAGASRRRRSGARRGLITVLVLVLVLAVLTVAADMITRKVAEDRLGTILQTELGMDTPPSVDIGGVPFLTQLAARDFGMIRLAAPQSTFNAGGREIPLEDIGLDAQQVTASDDWSQFTAGEINGSARMSWATLSEVIGAKAEYVTGPDGQARATITHTIEFQGVSVPVVLSGIPSYDPQTRKLELEEATVQIATYNLPAGLVKELLAKALQPIDLGLPVGIQLTSIQPTPEGLRINLSGTDVRFS